MKLFVHPTGTPHENSTPIYPWHCCWFALDMIPPPLYLGANISFILEWFDCRVAFPHGSAAINSPHHHTFLTEEEFDNKRRH